MKEMINGAKIDFDLVLLLDYEKNPLNRARKD